MGTGKSTIGKRLARKLSRVFYDCDHALEDRTGATINLIFEIEGETGFRKRETQLLDELTAKSDIVLATGGGVVLDAGNRAWLSTRGFVVYLKSDLQQLLKRTYKDGKRPLLKNGNPELILRELLKIREPLYEKTADLVIDTAQLSIHNTIAQIVSAESH